MSRSDLIRSIQENIISMVSLGDAFATIQHYIELSGVNEVEQKRLETYTAGAIALRAYREGMA